MKNKQLFLEKLRTEILKLDQTKYKIEDLLKGLNIDELEYDRLIKEITLKSLSLTSASLPSWDSISSFIYTYNLVESVVDRRGYEYGDMFRLIDDLVRKGIYGEYLLKSYTEDELMEVSKLINKDRDRLFNYAGITLLSERYLAFNSNRDIMELPQERFLVVSLHIAMKEPKEKRIKFIEDFYYNLSTLKVTVATPTLSNAGKILNQLASCNVLKISDDLESIYRNIEVIAKLSKTGSGIGVDMSGVRARGSAIRGIKNSSSGVMPWVKQINGVATSVNQLGLRNASIAVYLTVYHKDILDFLQCKLNSGDERTKAHDIFPAISYPSLFWRMAKEDRNSEWYLLCPYEVKKVKGYSLDDFYGEEWEKRYYECIEDDRIDKRTVIIKDILAMIFKSITETGMPFTFMRDHANEMNPNKHKGMIYSSNLCTEIMQNTSDFSVSNREFSEDGVIIETTESGDTVVCNLASLVLGNIDINNQEELEKIITTQIRGLDNVIDLNYHAVAMTKITNNRYRSIGLGTSGVQVMLGNEKVMWETKEHLDLIDKVYEDINYYAIKASMELAKEKGSYPYFEGSEWQTGKYFERRDYVSDRWIKLKEDVAKYGLRNGYIMAVAPNQSTASLSNSSEGIEPIQDLTWNEQKKGRNIVRVVPKLEENKAYYFPAFYIDNEWSIWANGRRQRHIDQASSFNFYITPDLTYSQILDLFILVDEMKIKTVYYTRSKSLELGKSECSSCSV